MKTYLLACLLLLFAVGLGQVPQLTSTTIKDFLTENNFVFVKFFAPYCGHCKKMAPEYVKLYEESIGTNIRVVQVDCTVERDICTEHNVQGFPSLKLYINGVGIDYNGERTSKGISTWATSFINKYSSNQLQTLGEEAAKNKIGQQDFVLVSGLTKDEQKSLFLANQFDRSNSQYYNLQSSTRFIRLYKKGSTEFQVYSFETLNALELGEWVFKRGRPAILYIESEQIFHYVKDLKDFQYVLALIDNDDELINQSFEEINGWCAQNLQQLLCVGVKKGSDYEQQLRHLTKAPKDTSVIGIIKSDRTLGYLYEGQSVTKQSLSTFFQNAKADKIYRHIDAERDNKKKSLTYKNVLLLDSTTFNSVLTQNKIVVVEFYLPSCVHCVNFAEEYDSLASETKSSGLSVIVAAVNAQQNQQLAKRENAQSYPTFKIYYNGYGLPYVGDRKKSAFTKTINDLASVKLLVASRKTDPVKPYIAISGIDSQSFLHVLPAYFTTFPIYQITGEDTFSIEVHSDEVSTYTGQKEILDITTWLELKTSPTLVSLGQSQASGKLKSAMAKKLPILAIFNKNQPESVEPVLNFLNIYCKDVTDFVCAFAHKGEPDFDDLIEYLEDKDKTKNKLFWIDVATRRNFQYLGDLDRLSNQQVDKFIARSKRGGEDDHQDVHEPREIDQEL